MFKFIFCSRQSHVKIEVNNVKPILHFFDGILTVMAEIPCLELYASTE
jgi:hypothetical protein